MVRVSCFAVNLILGEPRLEVSEAQEKQLTLARAGDPYFHAFRQRCMQWVYGDDPRRPAEP